MNRGAQLAVALGALAGLVACGGEPDPGVPRAKAAVPAVKATLCPTGQSEDPPRATLENGIVQFEAKEYKKAQATFRELAGRYPGSGTVRVWLGDALLFDKDLDEKVAAEAARPFYEAADVLHGKGCVVPRRPRYYQLMGEAFVALRLAKGADGYDARQLARAKERLIRAAAEFPTSAEVPYNLARVYCAEAGPSAGTTTSSEACRNELKKAFVLAESYERPRFLRIHRSTQDWIVRSRTQSEFSSFRKEKSYDELIAETLARPNGP